MAKYAQGTTVSVEKSESEIRAVLRKYGATTFVIGQDVGRAQVAFEMRDRKIIMRMALPRPADKAYTHFKRGSSLIARTAAGAHDAWEQACRERWRSLLLCLKAKLESVESGIETFDQAFLAHMMLPGGATVGEWVAEPANAKQLFATNTPPLLPGPRN